MKLALTFPSQPYILTRNLCYVWASAAARLACESSAAASSSCNPESRHLSLHLLLARWYLGQLFTCEFRLSGCVSCRINVLRVELTALGVLPFVNYVSVVLALCRRTDKLMVSHGCFTASSECIVKPPNAHQTHIMRVWPGVCATECSTGACAAGHLAAACYCEPSTASGARCERPPCGARLGFRFEHKHEIGISASACQPGRTTYRKGVQRRA